MPLTYYLYTLGWGLKGSGEVVSVRWGHVTEVYMPVDKAPRDGVYAPSPLLDV